MGKYLDKTGLQHFYDKLKEKFADKTTIENKLNSLTGALTWKGELSSLPAVTNYSAGNVIKVGKKEYVLTESNGTKTWDELGDEGSYLLKTTAEETYLKKAAGEVKTDNLAAGCVAKAKLDSSVQTSLGKADNSLQIGATNTQTKQTVITTESTETHGHGIKIKNSTDGTEISPKGVTFGGVANAPITMTYENPQTLNVHATMSGGADVFVRGVLTPSYDNDAANKKYVDNKTSGTIKICQTNEPVSGHEQRTTFPMNAAGYGGLKVTGTGANEVTELTGANILIGSMNPSGDGANYLSNRALHFGTGAQTFGEIKVNSNNKLQITGLDTPTSDTDAANKAYVDGKVSGKVDATTLTSLLGPLGLYEGTDDENKAANKAAISDYESKLTALGINIRNGYLTSWYCKNNSDYNGICFKSIYNDQIYGVVSFSGYICRMECIGGELKLYIYTTDDYQYNPITNRGDVNEIVNNKLIDELSNYQKSDSDRLETSDISVVGAINEVNTIAKAAAPKTSLATSLQAITIYTDNTDEHKAANIAAIKAYEDNLKLLGVDTSNDGIMIPIKFDEIDSVDIDISFPFAGYITKYGGGTYDGIVSTLAGNYEPRVILIYGQTSDSAGEVVFKKLALDSQLDGVVYKYTLATSLQAITIYTDNTAEHKAANLANIKAYEDNLKAMGVTTTKDHIIPIAVSGTIQKGFLNGNTSSNRYQGMMGEDNRWNNCVVASDGTFVSIPILTGEISQLNTTAKTSTINAINEVNTLAKSKASTAVATTSANGLMSSVDKKKLDGVLDAIANNASVNAMDIVSYDEQTGTYTGNAINLNGNDIKTEFAITVSGVTIAANTTMDDALKTVLTRAEKAVSDATYARDYGIREINGVNNSVVNFATSVSEPGDVEFNVTSNDGTTTDITAKVNGLGSAAYRDENYFATSSQGFAANSALQSVTAGGDEYINATVEKKDGTSQRINVSASVSTNISDTTTTGEYLADAYAVKQYVDSKAAGGSDMITFIYDDDSGALTTTAITDAQYKTITDAIKAGVNPNIQAAYITDGEYNYMPLCYQFDDGYYFGSIYCDSTSIRYTKIFCVNAVIDYASNNGKHSVDVTYNGTDFDSLIINIAKEVNTGTITISSTSGNANLPNKSGKYAITATTGSYTLTLPSSPSDGVTYEIYKYNSTHSLTISSGSTNIYVCELASTVKNKTYSSRSGKITIAYFASQSKWVVMRTDFGQ